MRTKAQKTKDSDPVEAYEQMIEDYDYWVQQLMVNSHMSQKEVEEETDFYRLIEIMNAKPRDKRPMSLWDFAASLDKERR